MLYWIGFILSVFFVSITVVVPACPSEDSSWCYWGDQTGDVFIALWMRDPAPFTIQIR